MSSFELVASLDTETQQAVYSEILTQSELFGKSPRVTYEGSAHVEVHDIILRGPVVHELNDTLHDLHERIECTDYMDYGKFPLLKGVIDKFVGDREIGRVIITALMPNGVIYPHADEGAVPEYYERFHYCVQGGHGNVFLVEGTGINIMSSELYKIDVRKKHSVINMMNQERVHVIVDVKRDA